MGKIIFIYPLFKTYHDGSSYSSVYKIPTDTVDQTDRPEPINNSTNKSPQYKTNFYINNKYVHSYIYTQLNLGYY